MKILAFAAALALVAVAAITTPALADDKDCKPPPGVNPHEDASLVPPKDATALALMKEGSAAHRGSDYKEAIAKYQQAIKIEAAPRLHYNLAQSYRLAGQYKEAITQYDLFLARARPPAGKALRGMIECHVRMMKAELERAAMTAPPIDPPPNEQTTRSAPSSAAGGSEVQEDEPESDEPEGDAPSPWYDDPVGWGLVGGGAATAGVAALLFVSAADLRDQAANEDREVVRTSLNDKADSRETWGTVALVAGGAALVGGVVKLVLTPDAPREERGMSFQVGPRYVGLVARF